MFLSASQLLNLLNCCICRTKLRDPRLAPCGKTICNACIISSTNADSIFKCICSEEIHPVPANGFPRNDIACSLLQEKLGEVYRSKKVDDFKHLLTKLKSETVDIQKGVKFSADKIKDYFSDIRNNIDLTTEKLIHKIQQHRSDLLTEINNYENKSLNHLKECNNLGENFEKSLEEMIQFYVQWINYLNDFRIDENVIEIVSKDCEENLKRLDEYKLALNKSLFGNSLVEFHENKAIPQKTIIGQVKLKAIYKYINFSNLRKIDFKSLDIPSTCSLINCELLDKNNVLIYFKNASLRVSCCVYNIKLDNFRTCFKELINTGHDIRAIKCCVYDKTIIFFVKTYSSGSYNNYFDIYLFDTTDMKYQSNHSYGFDLTDIQANSKNIFCLRTSGSLCIYNYNLKQTNDLESVRDSMKLSYSITKIKVSEKYCFVFGNDWLLAYIDLNEMRITKIDLKLGPVTVFNDSLIVHFEKSSKLVTYYELNGSKAHEEQIDTEINLWGLKERKDNTLFYYDTKDTLLIIDN